MPHIAPPIPLPIAAPISYTPASVEAASIAFAQVGPEAALATFDAAIAAEPHKALFHIARAGTLAMLGRYGEAWPSLELRRTLPDCPPDADLEWRGEALPAGATVLVLEQEGYGDTVMWARYLPLVAALGVRVVLACSAPLVPLMRRVAGVAEVVDAGAALPAFDRWTCLLNLPGLFGTTLDTVPSRDGYLTADPDRVAAWGAWLGRNAPLQRPSGLRVGLVWETGHQDWCGAMRSIPPACLAPLLDTPGVTFVALQAGQTLPPELTRPGVVNAGQHLHDLGETAAALTALDLVITPCTVTANLAGAMGLPALVLLPFASDWRWRPASDGLPAWYRSPVLVRQTAPGDWPGVVTEAAGVLKAFAGELVGA